MAQNTRARSANGDDRVGPRSEVPVPGTPGLGTTGAPGLGTPGPGHVDPYPDFFRELLQELRRDRQRPQLPPQPAQPQPAVFKAPEYNGSGSIEIFIRQFMDVVEANAWDNRAAVLHLRSSLKEGARDCGGACNDLAEIFTALRARFGISPREARVRMNSARKEANTPLQTHATLMRELVGIAYPDMTGVSHEQMALDQFINTLNNPRLQEHLLAIRPTSLTEAVTAGNEFLLIRQAQVKVRHLELEEEEEASESRTQVKPIQASPPGTTPVVQPATPGMVPPSHSVVTQQVPVQPNPVAGQPTLAVPTGPISTTPDMGNFQTLASLSDPMTALMAAVAQLTQGISQWQQSMRQRKERKPVQCWNCGQVGHLQSKCSQPRKDQGNRPGQQ